MDEAILAYTAGIVDGEGSISLIAQRGENPSPVVAVDSTDRELIDWLVAHYGGTVVVKKKQAEHHNQAWTWRLRYRQAIEFLEILMPYMVIKRKRERARMVVEDYVAFTPRNGRYTPEMRLAKDAMYRNFMACK